MNGRRSVRPRSMKQSGLVDMLEPHTAKHIAKEEKLHQKSEELRMLYAPFTVALTSAGGHLNGSVVPIAN